MGLGDSNDSKDGCAVPVVLSLDLPGPLAPELVRRMSSAARAVLALVMDSKFIANYGLYVTGQSDLTVCPACNCATGCTMCPYSMR